MRNFIIFLFLMLVSCQPIAKDISKKSLQPSHVVKHLTNDPVFYHGSSFGEYFQMLSRTGNYAEMVNITSIKDRINIGDSVLLSFYQQFDFSFPLTLKAYKREHNLIWLFYETNIMATRSTIQFPIIIENDSCKVCFEFLKSSVNVNIDLKHEFKF